MSARFVTNQTDEELCYDGYSKATNNMIDAQAAADNVTNPTYNPPRKMGLVSAHSAQQRAKAYEDPYSYGYKYAFSLGENEASTYVLCCPSSCNKANNF